MAPTKRKTDAKPEIASENKTTTRVTRSSARQASQGTTKVVVAETVPKTKKAKLSSKEKVESKPKTKEEAPLSEGVNGSKTKKAKLSSKAKLESKPKSTEEEPLSEGVNGSKTIVIEHCKQCNQFKIRAIKVKNGLETAVSGITVLINPEKPRRGCFEVREEGGKKFISLLDMKRPFAAMKALDMDVVISDIVEQIK